MDVLRSLLAGLLALLLLTPARAETVKLYYYHREPPFQMEGATGSELRGLGSDLAALLRMLAPKRQFVLQPLPRARLDMELEPWVQGRCPAPPVDSRCDSNWMLLWVTPQWGWGEKAETRFLWADLFRDADLIVSTRQHPVDYRSIADVKGLRIAAVRGHQLPPEFEALIQAGQMARDDGNYERLQLQRVVVGRADFTLIQRSAVNYLLSRDVELSEQRSRFHISAEPFKEFMLQAMVPITRSDLQALIQQAQRDPRWNAVLKRYGIGL